VPIQEHDPIDAFIQQHRVRCVFMYLNSNDCRQSYRLVSKDNSSLVNENDEFIDATCRAINIARKKYNAPAVQVNGHLSELAQRWAIQMAATGKLEHSPVEMRNFGRQTLGENYAAFFQTEITGETRSIVCLILIGIVCL
jgi:uncharacterized protein YkwD